MAAGQGSGSPLGFCQHGEGDCWARLAGRAPLLVVLLGAMLASLTKAVTQLSESRGGPGSVWTQLSPSSARTHKRRKHIKTKVLKTLTNAHNSQYACFK